MSREPNTEGDSFAPDLDRVNRSGFPFQIGVEHLISNSLASHGWQVSAVEHPWRDGFIDLVLSKSHLRTIVECKRERSRNDSTAWVFLAPAPAELRTTARCLRFTQVPYLRGYQELEIVPSAHLSSYAVLPKDQGGQGGTRLLECWAGDLVRASDFFAAESADVVVDFERELPLFFVPIIVTNAELLVCSFDSRAVDLKAGEIPDIRLANFQPVGLVHFRKTLTTDLTAALTSETYDTYSSNVDRQRSVFVVNVGHVIKFLEELLLSDGANFYPSPDALFR